MARNLTRNVVYSKNCLENALGIEGLKVTRAFYKKAEDSEVDPLKTARPFNEIPRVRMVPFLGSAWAYFPIIGKYSRNKLHEADIQKNRVYGDVVRERFGNTDIVSSYHPDTMRTLAENEGPYPSRSVFSSLEVYRQKRKEEYEPLGFLVSKGREWHEMRKSLTMYLNDPYRLKSHLDTLNEIAESFVRLISIERNGKNEVPDAVLNLRKWALESIAKVTLDRTLGCLTPNLCATSDSMKILNAVKTLSDCMYKMEATSGNIPLWKYFPTPTWQKFRRATDVYRKVLYNYINQSAANTSRFNALSGQKQTFMQVVLVAERETIADMIISGLDTVSYTAGFLLYNLAKNPDKQELAYDEISQLLPKEEDKMTIEIYEKLGYLKYCLKESMRLHPTVRGNVRVLDRDVAVNGYRVPAGTTIICVHQVIHRNEKYFKNADRYLPERWSSTDLNEFAYQPFGYGKRSCLGRDLAEMEIVTLATEVLRKYAVEYHYEDMGMNTSLINVPDKPLRLRFVERTPNQFLVD